MPSKAELFQRVKEIEAELERRKSKHNERIARQRKAREKRKQEAAAGLS